MTWLDSIILGIVEGVTEFLPISSTGHLILAGSLLGIPQSEFLKTFEVFIQLGAILAVLVVFWRRFLDIEVLKKLFVAFIPTGIIGLALYKVVKTYLLGNEMVVLWSLLLGGIALIVFEYWHTESKESVEDIRAIPYSKALGIGLFQSMAIVPGVSRSAASIVGGLMLGLKRETIVEFSFLLAVPTMAAASVLDLLKDAKNISSSGFSLLALGFMVAFAVALFSIVWLLRFVRTHTFVPFGVYRIVVAVLFLTLLVR
jgi:undecaprenyl-diphosphatase